MSSRSYFSHQNSFPACRHRAQTFSPNDPLSKCESPSYPRFTRYQSIMDSAPPAARGAVRSGTIASRCPANTEFPKSGTTSWAHFRYCSPRVRSFQFIWFGVTGHSSFEVELSGVRSDSRRRLQSPSASLRNRHPSWPGSMSRPQS